MCLMEIAHHRCGHQIKSGVVIKCTTYYTKEEAKKSLRKALFCFNYHDCGDLKYYRVDHDDFCSQHCPVARKVEKELKRIERDSWQRAFATRRESRECEQKKMGESQELARRRKELQERAAAASREYEENKKKEEEALRRQMEAKQHNQGKLRIQPLWDTACGTTDFRKTPDQQSGQSTLEAREAAEESAAYLALTRGMRLHDQPLARTASRANGAMTGYAPPRLADRPLHPNAFRHLNPPNSCPPDIQANAGLLGGYAQGTPNQLRMRQIASLDIQGGSHCRREAPHLPREGPIVADPRPSVRAAQAQVRRNPQSREQPPVVQSVSRRPVMVNGPALPQPSRAVISSVVPPEPPDPRRLLQLPRRPVQGQASAVSPPPRTQVPRGAWDPRSQQPPPVPPKTEYRPPVPAKNTQPWRPPVLPESGYRPPIAPKKLTPPGPQYKVPVPPKDTTPQGRPNVTRTPPAARSQPVGAVRQQLGSTRHEHVCAPVFSNHQLNRPSQVSPPRAAATATDRIVARREVSVVEGYRPNPMFASRAQASTRPAPQASPPSAPARQQPGRAQLRVDTRPRVPATSGVRHHSEPVRPTAPPGKKQNPMFCIFGMFRKPLPSTDSLDFVCKDALQVEKGPKGPSRSTV